MVDMMRDMMVNRMVYDGKNDGSWMFMVIYAIYISLPISLTKMECFDDYWEATVRSYGHLNTPC